MEKGTEKNNHRRKKGLKPKKLLFFFYSFNFINNSSRNSMGNGIVTNVKKLRKRKPDEKYLNLQGKLKHLFAMEGGSEEIKKIQAIADWNVKHFGLE
jgi:pyruvate/2-oxoacid:ferredoxin oxidoreductase beta subunit